MLTYQGVPLINDEGHALGTLCLLDTQPRTLTSKEKNQLRFFGHEVMDKLELHRTKHELEERNHEVETLLNEIHHRVKNNYQVTLSVINLEERKTTSTAVIDVLNTIKTRIRSMADVHELLYDTDELDNIDPAEHFQSIIETNRDIHPERCRNLTFSVESEVRSLDINQALPCGLIVNELIANSIEHGYDNGDRGTIDVRLTHESEQLRLSVSNDGYPLPDSFSLDNTDSIGMTMVENLSEKQLKGRLDFSSNDKTEFYTTFGSNNFYPK